MGGRTRRTGAKRSARSDNIALPAALCRACNVMEPLTLHVEPLHCIGPHAQSGLRVEGASGDTAQIPGNDHAKQMIGRFDIQYRPQPLQRGSVGTAGLLPRQASRLCHRCLPAIGHFLQVPHAQLETSPCRFRWHCGKDRAAKPPRRSPMRTRLSSKIARGPPQPPRGAGRHRRKASPQSGTATNLKRSAWRSCR